MKRSVVVVKKTRPNTGLYDLEEIIQAAGLLSTLNPSRFTVLKDNISQVNFGFKVWNNLASTVGHALWFSPANIFQWLFFHTPTCVPLRIRLLYLP